MTTETDVSRGTQPDTLPNLAFYGDDIPEPLKSSGSFNITLLKCAHCNQPYVAVQPSNRGQVSIILWRDIEILDDWGTHKNCPEKHA